MRMTKDVMQGNLGTVLKGAVGALAITLTACGGSSSSPPAPGSVVILEDANIIGGVVSDANGRVAADRGNGRYQFGAGLRNPVLPITASSQNTLSNGLIVGEVLTYQDMNNNNVYDSAVDVPFNASLQLAYTSDPLIVYFNPLSALVPASGIIPAAGIAGVSRASVESAMTKGLDEDTPVEVRRLVAQLIALQESAILLGVPADEVHTIITEIATAVAADDSIDLLADFSGGIETVLTGNTNVQSIFSGVIDPVTNVAVNPASVGPVLTAFAVSIEAVTDSSVGNTNSEAIIKVLQDNVAADPNLASVDTVINNLASDGGAVDADVLAADFVELVQAQSIAQVENEQSETGIGTVVEQLFIMPVFYQYDGSVDLALLDGDVCNTCEVGIEDDDLNNAPYNVTNFSMTYDSTADTLMLQDDAAFNAMLLSFTETCSLAGGACYKHAETGLFVEIYLNWLGRTVMLYDYGVSYDLPTGGSGTTHIFPLANQDQICNFTLASGASLAQAQLDEINLRNAATVSCTSP